MNSTAWKPGPASYDLTETLVLRRGTPPTAAAPEINAWRVIALVGGARSEQSPAGKGRK